MWPCTSIPHYGTFSMPWATSCARSWQTSIFRVILEYVLQLPSGVQILPFYSAYLKVWVTEFQLAQFAQLCPIIPICPFSSSSSHSGFVKFLIHCPEPSIHPPIKATGCWWGRTCLGVGLTPYISIPNVLSTLHVEIVWTDLEQPQLLLGIEVKRKSTSLGTGTMCEKDILGRKSSFRHERQNWQL